ncbi:MAG: IS1634 family transposase [Candidatus Riflebacteria bacterium]|nr:IS1634 family transposase [Candidatus Riflebacteria bacterium]
MFVRRKTVRTPSATHQYLQLVESRREGKRVVQEVIANLGRLDKLLADGSLDRLIESLGRFSEKLVVLDALRDGDVVVDDCPEWGPALVFGRLWKDLGLEAHLKELASSRGFEFDVERVAFAIALQRIVKRNTGSDRDGLAWLDHCRSDGLCDGHGWVGVQLQHFYRTVALLGQHKEAIEERLWARNRNLYNYKVDVALFDTTSAYFEGEGPDELAKLGKSKDGKYDCKQVIIGVVMTQDGWPICCEVWPGNTSDSKTVVPILDALKKRFQLGKLVFISDRGMVSKANLKAIVGAEYDYIVGCKLRGDKTVREKVLSRPGRYHKVEANLRVKEVKVAAALTHAPQARPGRGQLSARRPPTWVPSGVESWA